METIWLDGSGLSPRVRGNRSLVMILRVAMGSIPACAGEPAHVRHFPSAFWVYPRVCGGTCNVHPHRRQFRGLSPRVRGNPRHWR